MVKRKRLLAPTHAVLIMTMLFVWLAATTVEAWQLNPATTTSVTLNSFTRQKMSSSPQKWRRLRVLENTRREKHLIRLSSTSSSDNDRENSATVSLLESQGGRQHHHQRQQNGDCFPAMIRRGIASCALVIALLASAGIGSTFASATIDETLSSSTAMSTTTTTTAAFNEERSGSDTTARSALPVGKRYWTIVKEGDPEERVAANKALLDYAVGTIQTMYYDHSGGAFFQPRDFQKTWKTWLQEQQNTLETRSGAVAGLQWLVQQVQDPFSAYLTREQLRAELEDSWNHGFLGIGVVVESPGLRQNPSFFGAQRAPVMATPPPEFLTVSSASSTKHRKPFSSPPKSLMSAVQVASLPVVTVVAPDSPAERSGLVVGDRIVAVGKDNFLLHRSAQESQSVVEKLSSADNYVGHPDLTVATPVYVTSMDDALERNVIVGYRLVRIRIPTALTVETDWSKPSPGFEPQESLPAKRLVAGGNAVVHFELLQRSIFEPDTSPFGIGITNNEDESSGDDDKLSIGYIRLTRFSRASTAGFLHAVEELEAAGASGYIIDLRNNYGGVIQEAMLTASTLLRDPHAVLCYTLNSRGGFTPHDVEEFAVDRRYPGYLLSSESSTATLEQIKQEKPGIFQDENNDIILWTPPSSYVSLHEQRVQRGIRPARSVGYVSPHGTATARPKPLVLLTNEGTASAAEVFVAALHDNGRTVATVGTRTFGKGLIQHTFPMPDGGGLRLTVAEYLTPALKHVTMVGGAQFDPITGDWVGGGIRPDITCSSNRGIPRNVGADFCVGRALDALTEAEIAMSSAGHIPVSFSSSLPSTLEATALDDSNKVLAISEPK